MTRTSFDLTPPRAVDLPTPEKPCPALALGMSIHAPRQHFLCLRPLPQGQGSLRPTFGVVLAAVIPGCGISEGSGCPPNCADAI